MRRNNDRPYKREVKEPAAQSTKQPAVDLDEAFRILSNDRRQRVIGHVADRVAIGNDSEIDLGELAEDIAAAELDKPLTEIDSQERKRVYVALYQTHMPKLVDVGVVDNAEAEQPSRTEFVPGPNAELFASLLGGAREVIHESNRRSGVIKTVGEKSSDDRLVSRLASWLEVLRR